MPSTYTLNNGIELIGTGEQSGTWGDTTNTNFELLDTALDGQVTVTLASAGTSGSPNDLPIDDGSASNGRNRMIIFNDGADLGATAYVQLTPNDAEKIIYVRNALSGDQDLILFQGTYSASNDYVVPAGKTAVIFFDGAGTGAVAANVFNNAHFDALNVVGGGAFGGAVTVTTGDSGATASSNADDFVVEASGDGGISILNPASNTGTLFFGDPSAGNMGQIKYSHTDDEMSIVTAQNTAMVIDSSRRVLIGHTSALTTQGGPLKAQIVGANATSGLDIFTGGASALPRLNFTRSRNATPGSFTIVQDGDLLGLLSFMGDDSADYQPRGAQIKAEVDGTPGINDMPGRLIFATTSDGADSTTERMRITSSGNVGIASGGDVDLDSTDIVLQIGSGSYSNPTIQIRSGTSGTGKLWFGDNSGTSQGRYAGAIMYSHSSNRMDFGTASDTVMNLNSSGDLNIGSGNSNHEFYSARLNVSDTSSQVASFTRYASTQNGPSIFLAKSRSATVGTNTIVQSGDDLGFVQFTGADGTDYQPGARIYAEVDGTPGVGDMPGRLIFDTTPDGASAGVERMRVHSSGDISMSGSSGTVGTLKGRGSLTISDNHGDNTGGAVAFHYTGNGGYSEIYIENNNTLVLNADPTAAGSNTSIKFRTDNTLAAMIDDTQRLLVGPSSALSTAGGAKPRFQVAGSSFEQSSMFLGRGAANANASGLNFVKTRNANFGGQTILQNNDQAMYIGVYGDDGTDNNTPMASIVAEVDGTPGANDMPGRIRFSTTADGSSGVTERMRIDNAGRVGIGTNTISGYNAYGDGLVVKKSSIAASSGITIQAPQNTGYSSLYFGDPDDTKVGWAEYSHGADSLTFGSGNGVTMVLDSSQRVLIGLTSSAAVASTTAAEFQVETTGIGASIVSNAGAVGPAGVLALGHKRGAGGIVSNGDALGDIRFAGHDGTDLESTAGQIRVSVGGTPGSNDMPGMLQFYTTSDGSPTTTERMRIISTGHVKIGSAGDPETMLQVQYGNIAKGTILMGANYDGVGMGNNQVKAGALHHPHYTSDTYPNGFRMLAGYSDSANNLVQIGGGSNSVKAATQIRFYTGTSITASTNFEAMRIDSSQRVLLHQTSSYADDRGFQTSGTATDPGNAFLQVNKFSADIYSGGLSFFKSRGANKGNNGLVSNGDQLFAITGSGNDGGAYKKSVDISGYIDSAAASNDMPGRLVFSTTADGTNSPTERMRIDNLGKVSINGTSDYGAVFFSKSYSETNAALHLASSTQTAAGYKIWTGLGSVTPTSGTLSFTIGQVGGTSPRAAMFEINVVGRHANNGSSYHALLQFQVFIQLSSTQAVSLRSGGEIGISYIWDYATDVSFTNNGNGTCTIDLDIRPYVSTAYWTIIRKSSAWTAELQSVSYS